VTSVKPQDAQLSHGAFGIQIAIGAKDALIFPAWVVAFALIGIGSVARESGFPGGVAALSTLLIWAGPSQIIFFGSIATGMALPSVALAVTLSSFRFLPMTMTIMPLLRQKKRSLIVEAFSAHFVAVTVWSECLRRLPLRAESQRLPYFLGFAFACIGLSTLSTLVGYFLVDHVNLVLASGMLFLTPAFFILSVSAGAKSTSDWLAIIIGLTLQPLSQKLFGPEIDLLVIGLFGGTCAYLVHRRFSGGRS
jgi:predicted branched-subunit amino acid permease